MAANCLRFDKSESQFQHFISFQMFTTIQLVTWRFASLPTLKQLARRLCGIRRELRIALCRSGCAVAERVGWMAVLSSTWILSRPLYLKANKTKQTTYLRCFFLFPFNDNLVRWLIKYKETDPHCTDWEWWWRSSWRVGIWRWWQIWPIRRLRWGTIDHCPVTIEDHEASRRGGIPSD